MRNDAYSQVRQPVAATTLIPGTVKNHTGGAVFQIGDLDRARRFLIIGSTGGTYYQREKDITRENYEVIARLAATKPTELVALIEDVSVRGLAPKVDPQLFALAVCTSQPGAARVAAFEALPRIVRTGSHLLMWARYNKALGGKVGRAWRRTVADWFLTRTPDKLAYQLAKYRQRDGWAQKDLIDMSHALSGSVPREIAAALSWARGSKDVDQDSLPLLLATLDSDGSVRQMIEAGASWEMLPDAELGKAETWTRLLAERKLPIGAAMRQLSRMTQVGVFDAYFANESASALKAMFGDEETLRRARIHPINVLLAQMSYGEGNRRSGGAYTPIPRVMSMLDDAFYRAFETAPASGKRTLVGVDISSSMTYNSAIAGLSSHAIATVLAMKILRSEPSSYVVGFADRIRDLGMTPTMDLAAALRTTQGAFGATNPGALIEYATQRGIPVDTFIVITDNEVNRGRNVSQLLAKYRADTGIDAKMIVLGVTATDCSIADPADPGMLDIAGFGTDVPALITEFSRG